MLVHDLPHLCLLRYEDLRSKEEDDVEHTSLCGQRRAPMLWVRVSHNLYLRREERGDDRRGGDMTGGEGRDEERIRRKGRGERRQVERRGKEAIRRERKTEDERRGE